MALSIIKAQAGQTQEVKPVAVAQSIAPIMAAEQDAAVVLIDELVQIEQYLENAKVKQAVKRQAELRKQLASSVPEGTPETDTYTFKGTMGSIVFSGCSVTSSIPDLSKVVDSLGSDVFMKIAKVGLTDLKAYMTEAEFAKVSVKGWGSRSFKAYISN